LSRSATTVCPDRRCAGAAGHGHSEDRCGDGVVGDVGARDSEPGGRGEPAVTVGAHVDDAVSAVADLAVNLGRRGGVCLGHPEVLGGWRLSGRPCAVGHRGDRVRITLRLVTSWGGDAREVALNVVRSANHDEYPTGALDGPRRDPQCWLPEDRRHTGSVLDCGDRGDGAGVDGLLLARSSQEPVCVGRQPPC
jgi:hypothetical protein